MRRFILTSGAFPGEVYFEFNELNFLVKFDQSGADLSEEQQIFLLKRLPRELAEVQRVFEGSPSAKFTELKSDVNFDQFWNRYDEKIRSSKKKALQKWIRLSQLERNLAYYFISKYEVSIPQGVPKKYAETYLHSEIWNN
jgi:hypothetical protein